VLVATNYGHNVSIRALASMRLWNEFGGEKKMLGDVHARTRALALTTGGSLTLGIDFILTAPDRHRYADPPKREAPGKTRPS
jgi:hypothetical protein